MGDKNYFDILGSGIVSFDGIKDYLSTSSVNGSRIEYVEEEVSFRQRPSRANMQPIPNSVWFAKMKNTLKVLAADSYLCEQAILSTGYCGIHSEKVISPYLKQIILSTEFNNQKDRLAEGSTQEAINTSKVKNIQLYFPQSIHEQAKIAQVLATVDQAIAQTEALISKQQRIKTGLMQDLLTRGIDEHGNLRSEKTHTFKDSPLGKIPVEWEVDIVGKVFEIQLGKMLSQKATEGVSPFQYLGNRSVQWDRVDTSELQLMDFKEWERQKFDLKPGDILVCEGGEVGRTAIWRGEIENCYYQKAIHRLRTINNRFLNDLFPRFMKWAKTRGLLSDYISQTSIAHLTKEKLSIVPIFIPSTPEQVRLNSVLNQFDNNLGIQSAYLSKLRSLKTALVQDLLSGRKPVISLLEDPEVVDV